MKMVQLVCRGGAEVQRFRYKDTFAEVVPAGAGAEVWMQGVEVQRCTDTGAEIQVGQRCTGA